MGSLRIARSHRGQVLSLMAVGILALGGAGVAIACCSPLPATLVARAQELSGGPDVDDVPSRIDLGQPAATPAVPAPQALSQPDALPAPSPTPGSTTVVQPPVYVYAPDGRGGDGGGSGRGGPGPSGR